MKAPRTIYFEFVTLEKFVKATAIDPATQCEASIVAPAGTSRAALEDAARRKLSYVVKKTVGK